jgi:O-antigen ligase
MGGAPPRLPQRIRLDPVRRLSAIERFGRDAIALAIGTVGLAAAALTIVLGPASWWTLVLAVIATIALWSARPIGPMAAPLATIIALPFGRAADVAGLQIAGIPVRPHDAVLVVAIVAVILALPRIRRPPVSWALVAFGGFIAIGVVATVVGLAGGDQALRGVVRDARWWFLYAFGAVLLLLPARRAAVVRAVLIGCTVFGLTVIAASLLPEFSGGLKDEALRYDGGLLRLQYNNTSLLLPGLAYAAHTLVRHRRLRDIAWLAVLLGAALVSLTRTYLAVAIVVVAVVIVWSALRRRRSVSRDGRAVASRRVAAAVIAAAVVGAGVIASNSGAREAIARVVVSRSDFSGLSGRFYTYRAAWDLIAERPVLGLGMGQLVRVPFADGSRSYVAGMQPGVDNAYLTVGMKAGLSGMAAFALLALVPIAGAVRPPFRRWRPWYLPAWLGLLVLTMTQSYATSGYGPLVIGALIALPFMDARTRWRRPAH